MSFNENDVLRSLDDAAHRARMEQLFHSDEYSNLVKQLSVNNARFEELPEKVKLVAIYLNGLGLDVMLKDMWTLLYLKRPPTFKEFLTPEHGGSFANDLFSGWRNVFTRDFVDAPKAPQELVFSGSIGCHAADEGILMYDGSIKMSQDVQVGDQLMGPDSQPRTVLELKRGRDELYRVTTHKQDSFIVNGHHLLHLDSRSGKKVTRRDVTVNDFLNWSAYRKRSSYLIRSGVEYAAAEHNISSYFLGVLLGDGNFSTATKIRFYASEQELKDYVETYVPYELNMFLHVDDRRPECRCYYICSEGAGKLNKLRQYLRILGLEGKTAKYKFIPNEYLIDSRENRLDLLAGLIDTDGYYSPEKNAYVIGSVSLQLAKDIIRLCLSLGFFAHYYVRYNRTGKSAKIQSVSYVVNISGELDAVPVKVKKKIARKRLINKQSNRFGIKSIEHLGRGNYYGWCLDADHLYLDDSYLIHHNTGKCHGPDEGILMHDGSIKMSQDVRVGDRLMGPDSKPRTVQSIGSNRGDLYKITTKKGESFVVNADHVLVLDELQQRIEGKKRLYSHVEKQISVKSVLALSPNKVKYHLKLKKAQVEYPEQAHVLSPYFVGMLLGDGSLHQGIALHTADDETANEFKAEADKFGLQIRVYPDSGHLKYKMSSGVSKVGSNPVLTELKRLELMSKNWNNKSIPHEYRIDSRDNRLQLLAGLIDTDGHYCKRCNTYEFYSKSPELAKDVESLARGLGFNARAKTKIINSQHVKGALHYRVLITGDLTVVPCRLPRKRARPRLARNNVLHHGIASIEHIGQGDFYGFQLDGDHLYLDDDYFVHHNTTTATFLHVWNLIRVCLLRNPQSTLGVAFNTLLVLALFTVTLDKASLALIRPFTTLLEDSPYFIKVDKPNELEDKYPNELVPFLVRNGRVEFPRNIIINIGSTVSHAISYSMFGAMLDEAEFRGKIEDSFAVYTNLRERIRSRFLGSVYTLLTLMSSARYSTGIIADYVKSIDPADLHTKVYSFAIWEIKNFESYRNKPWFKVLRGTTEHPHRLLTDTESAAHAANTFVIPAGCEVISVPEAYRNDFAGPRISEALQNLAGIPVLFTASYPFTDLSRVEQTELTPEVYMEAELGSKTPLISKLPASMFKTVFEERRFSVSPAASRVISVDLAETSEAGVTIGHLSTKTSEAGVFVFVVDVVIKVTSPTRIDIGLIRDLILDIADVCHVYLVTADQYQSTLLRQEVELSGKVDHVKLLSVDKTVEPYSLVARLVQNDQFYVGKCALLKNQLKNIQIDDKKSAQKITGSKEYRKDMADSVTQCAYSCLMNANNLTVGQTSDWMNRLIVPAAERFKGMESL